MNTAKSSSAEQEQKILFLQQKLFEQQHQLQQQQLMQAHAAQFQPQITSTFSHFPPPSTGTFLPVAAPSPQREEAFQELFNSVAASPLPETTIFPTPPPTQFKQRKNITLMKQMFHNTEPAVEALAAGLLAESLPNFEENIEYDNDDNDDDKFKTKKMNKKVLNKQYSLSKKVLLIEKLKL